MWYNNSGDNMDYVKKYEDYLTYEKNYSKNTVISYLDDLKVFETYLKGKNISFLNCDFETIYDYMNYLSKLKYSNKSISRNISCLRSFYKYLTKEGYIKENPMLLVSNPKVEKKLPKYLNVIEIEDILDSIDQNTKLGLRDKLIVELLYSTGIRVSELVNIKVNDINLSEKKIIIKGKGNKERVVLFGSNCYNLLNSYLKDHNHEYLILNSRDNKITDRGIRVIIDKIIANSSVKLKISPHVLRHTFATHMLNEGADLITVKDLLGHESLATTQIYTHVSNERLRNVYLKCHPRSRK